MNMYQNYQLVCTGLEDKMFDIGEQDLDDIRSVIPISQTIGVDLYFSSNTLAV